MPSQLSSGDASDSICPKGWGMAGLEGDRSYWKFIKSAYGMNKTETSVNRIYEEYNFTIAISEFNIQKILNFVRSGNYDMDNGNFNQRTGGGTYISKTGKIRTLFFYNTSIFTKGYSNSLAGFSLRCEAKSYFFLPVMLLTLSAPKGGEWEDMMEKEVTRKQL